ncbi:MAG: tryptophan synthase subunit alpha [Nitrospirota bacterium]|jgi:tryptophan synthase alpha chain
MTRIGKTFKKLKRKGRKAFIPYIMAGDPSLERTGELIGLLERHGADIVELGVPFSDPLADGPVIQRAAERALKGGVSLRKVIRFVSDIRRKTQIPLVLMTYFNPVFRYGLEAFMRDASEAGVDGVIVPDLPPEEAGEYRKLARAHGVDTIFLVAPTSTEERRKKIARASSGFLYYVSITGITGARLALAGEAGESIRALREMSGKPVALGFGVSTPEEARQVAAMADGVIVGSAIVKRIAQDTSAQGTVAPDTGVPDSGLEEFLTSLREAI